MNGQEMSSSTRRTIAAGDQRAHNTNLPSCIRMTSFISVAGLRQASRLGLAGVFVSSRSWALRGLFLTRDAREMQQIWAVFQRSAKLQELSRIVIVLSRVRDGV